MPITSAREMIVQAAKEGYCVGAFNVTNMVQLQAVVEAAVEKKSPLIIQTSVSPSKSVGPEVWATLFKAMAASAPVPLALHLDHCTDVEYCKRCVDAGYTSVMIDASKQLFEENVRQTMEVCAYAHARGVSVEGELGTVSGVEDQVRVAENETALCDPDKAVVFVARTKVDFFAPAIGTAHGIYLTKNPKLDFDRLGKIQKLVNRDGIISPLVIHGGTGLPEDSVRRLVGLGGAKLNVSTELKHVLIDSTFEYIGEHREEYDPGKLDGHVKKAIKQAIHYWIDLLGSAGKAG